MVWEPCLGLQENFKKLFSASVLRPLLHPGPRHPQAESRLYQWECCQQGGASQAERIGDHEEDAAFDIQPL